MVNDTSLQPFCLLKDRIILFSSAQTVAVTIVDKWEHLLPVALYIFCDK
jgi:hypothetical protein